ncbi:MAG: hypothetical protein OES57_01300 [Acidimicrobiia bacterium]|nr:hypothetical protein [Acidimicrobiia bacterium]
MSQQADDFDLEGNDRGFNGRVVVLVLLAIVLVVFIFQNTASQEIKFLGFESEPPLWVSLLLAAVLGALVGQLGMWLYRRSRRRRHDPDKR